ncbi:MAG: RNA polymerase subunit sigma-70 [Tildeniella torsiva UHER 1998/13D]|jgi:RNA polymerase sigma-70 factor (ECF subfamily)|nr:RNA polymerase subunit sigma-70 [Tildeniella torsiva UHER 1998/13D]
MTDARRVVETTARASYGRLLAYLASRSRDVMAAEDALGDAFMAALQTWPAQGTPPNPEAWLLLAAKRKLIDGARRGKTQDKVVHWLETGGRTTTTMPDLEELTFPDERLKLLFVCAHPAIDASIHTPLMLQTILGLNAHQIASAFLVSPTTMGQRLVRAKAKIRDAGIAFEIPEVKDLPVRLQAVLEAIYAVYTLGWDNVAGSDARHQGLTEEAIWLAHLCVDLMPEEPEAKGLLALMLFCEARAQARRTAEGAYVPLSEQNTELWSQDMLHEAEQHLRQAAAAQRLGRFQLEAAIQSAHMQRSRGQAPDWDAIVLLYEGLLQIAPTLGARVSQAAAIAEAQGFTASLQALETIPPDAVKNYQPYWALKAHLLHNLNQAAAAKDAYQRAIGLSEDAAIRDFLLARLRLSLG